MTYLALKGFRKCLSATALAVASLTVAGHAQVNEPLLLVNVPFAFESDSHHFVAGTYFVRVGTGRLTIQGAGDQMITSVVRDENLDAARKSSVVFRRYGDRYFLREVWVAGHKEHVHCVPTKGERQVQIAFANQHATGVAVALLDSPK